MSTPRTGRRARLYEDWPGNEEFFCNGRVVTGPGWQASIGTSVLIAAPSGVWIGLVMVRLLDEMDTAPGVVLLVLAVLWPLWCIGLLLKTAFTDPGIIPRRSEPDEEFARTGKHTKRVPYNGKEVEVRYNETCKFYQPPRAHHCSVTNDCIERFDHYCPWVGTTIGLRNYRTFFAFILSTAGLLIYVIVTSALLLDYRFQDLKDNDTPDDKATVLDAIADEPATIALIIFCFLCLIFVGALSCFHAYLVATNQTTYENFRYDYAVGANPYDRGCCGNCYEVWLQRIPPAQADFRAFVDEVESTRQRVNGSSHGEGDVEMGSVHESGFSTPQGVSYDNMTPSSSSAKLAGASASGKARKAKSSAGSSSRDKASAAARSSSDEPAEKSAAAPAAKKKKKKKKVAAKASTSAAPKTPSSAAAATATATATTTAAAAASAAAGKTPETV